MKFFDLYKAGHLKMEVIDGFIDSWNKSTSEDLLSEYLGMTPDEYSSFVNGSLRMIRVKDCIVYNNEEKFGHPIISPEGVITGWQLSGVNYPFSLLSDAVHRRFPHHQVNRDKFGLVLFRVDKL